MLATLRARTVFWCFCGVITGVVSAGLWMSSQSAWEAYLNRAQNAGTMLYHALRQGTDPPPGIAIIPLTLAAGQPMATRDMPAFRGLPSPARVTSVSIISNRSGTGGGARLQVHIVSPDRRYQVAQLEPSVDASPAARLGALTRLLARYCSEPLLFARFEEGEWRRIDGTAIWGCGAAPSDLRLLSLAILVGGMILILTRITDAVAGFEELARDLKRHRRRGDDTGFRETGPRELRDIVRSLNAYIALERQQLEKRAMVLSGVSHDLGTPATRLRLRTALIEDEELRGKLETDIDKMTSMIESVLTYTRSEMNAEDPCEISLTSLVESVVADYGDVGKPVRLGKDAAGRIGRSRSIFGGGGDLRLPADDARRLLVTARPISLQRAISNLIDNSLKYGRRATVSVKADSEIATITVEDEGGAIAEDAMNALTAPFQRGENTGAVDGTGLGLTIVSTIAQQHGGEVTFERGAAGLKAVFTMRRQ